MNVVIDPGHGGVDPGACGNGLIEKDITLAIAERVKSYLSDYGNVIVTRDSDINIPLRQRAEMSKGADCFISVHANSVSSSEPRGYESFIHTTAKDMSEDARLQKCVSFAMARYWDVDRGMKKADYYVLRNRQCPSILVECGFISNKSDAARMDEAHEIDEIAVRLSAGILGYFYE